ADSSESGEGLGADLGWFPFPAVDGGEGGPNDVLGGCDGYAFGANAPDAAVDFARFVTNLENQTSLTQQGITVLPTVKGAESAVEDENLLAVADALAKAEYFQ